MEFFETMQGKRFFESTMVKVAKNLERIAGALEKANELKERELALKEKKAEKKE